MASQLDIERAINRALKERTSLLQEQSGLINDQLGKIAGLSKAWEGAGPQEIIEAIEQVNEALAQTAEEAAASAAASGEMSTKMQAHLGRIRGPVGVLLSQFQKLKGTWPALTAGAAAFVDGLVSGFKFVKNVLSSTLDLLGSIASGFMRVSTEILMMPFRSLEALIQVSNRLTEIMEAVARATEEVRQQFGDLATNAGGAVMRMARDVGKGFEHLGLGSFRVFGSMDEVIQHVNKTMTEMGSAFEALREEFQLSGGELLLMQRGLGLTGEHMGSLARRAKAMGRPLGHELGEMTKYSKSFGAAFGISAKTISRDMGEMVKDVQHFGNMGPKELAKISVYAKKLVIDTKELLGVIDKFDTFEDAAISAAMLSQAFGAQTDAVKLMRAESPADRVDELRRAFFSAGKSAEHLTRQELKLLSQTTGLSEEAARAAFSQKNMGDSMQDLEKQGRLTEKRQLSTAEAIQKMADQIERAVKPFGKFKSFLGAFADGFTRGMLAQEQFRGMLMKLDRALAATYRMGMQVGNAFVEAFPGMKKMLAGLSDLLSLGEDAKGRLRPFSAFLEGVKKGFESLFKSIAGGGPVSIVKLMETVKTSFFDSFAPDTLKGRALLRQLNEFTGAVGRVFAGMVRAIAEGIEKGSRLIESFIKGEKLPRIPGKGFASNIVNPVADALEESWPRVKTAVIDLLETAWKRAEGPVMSIAGKIGAAFMLAMFTSAVIKVATTLAMFKIAAAMNAAAIAKAGATGAAAGTGTFASVGSTIAAAVSNPVGWIAAGLAAMGALGVGVNRGMEEFLPGFEERFGNGLQSRTAAAAAGVADTFTIGLLGTDVASSIGEWVASAAMTMGDIIRSTFGERVADSLRAVFDSQLDVFSSFGGLIEALFEGDAGTVVTRAELFGRDLMDSIINVVTDMLPAFVEIGAKLLGFMLVKAPVKLLELAITKLVPAVGQTFSLMGAAVFGMLSGMVKHLRSWLKLNLGGPFMGAIDSVLFGFEALFGGVASGFAWFADTFATWRRMLDAFGGSVGVISVAWEGVKLMFKDTITWLMDKTDIFFALDYWKELGLNVLKGLKHHLEDVGNVLIEPLTTGIELLKKKLGISSPSRVMMQMGDDMSQGLIKGLGNIPTSMNEIVGSGMDAAAKAVELGMPVLDSRVMNAPFLSDAKKSPAIRMITGLVEEANAINDSLANLPPINLEARLEALADRIGVKKENFTIKHDKLNIVINLDVTMEAEKLAKVLSEQNIITKQSSRRG